MGADRKDNNKKERWFSQEQYDMLLRCSEKKDMTEWNEWREANPNGGCDCKVNPDVCNPT
jgi:hypothetical protein